MSAVVVAVAVIVTFVVGAWVLLGKVDRAFDGGLRWLLLRSGMGEEAAGKATKGIGLLALVAGLVWVFWSGDKPAKEPVALTAPAVIVPAAEQKPAEVAANTENCACGSGALCTGPRGGRYCRTESGEKRYNQR